MKKVTHLSFLGLASGLTLLLFQNFTSEELLAQNDFDEECYLARYPDVADKWVSNGGVAIDHWLKYGKSENRIPGCVPAIEPSMPTTVPRMVSGSKNVITGAGSLPIQITLSPDKFAGAVSSITWNGKEFINIFDHGRQLQSAMQVDGYHECNNPTEAGSERDGRGSTSTSKLLEMKKVSQRSIYSKSQMALWAYNHSTGACTKGLDTRLTSPLSEHYLEKRITIGALNDPQIVGYSIKFTHGDRTVSEKVVYEFLTGYVTAEFDRFFYLKLSNQALQEYTLADFGSLSGSGFPSGSYFGKAVTKDIFDPIVVSTANGSHAMGVYVPKRSILNCKSVFHGYGLYKFNLGGTGDWALRNATNKWSLALEDSISSSCFKDNTRTFKVYFAIGTLDAVRRKLIKITQKVP